MKTREELLKSGHSLDADSMIYGEKLVKAILSAPTGEQTKCEYCHKEKAIKLSENHYLEIAPPSDANLVEKRSFDYEGWQIGTTKFNYCPCCGRKLSDE